MRIFSILLGVLTGRTIAAQVPTANRPIEAESSMVPNAHPGFLVATIRPSDPNAMGGWAFPTDGHHISARNATVVDILSVAYGIHAKQIVGGPELLNKAKFDISGVPDLPGVPDFSQTQEMFQRLLAERFHLRFHRETRQIPIYALTVAKGGPRLKLAEPDGKLNTGNSGNGSQRTLKFTNMTMRGFALNMSLYEDRPVVDQTSLPGRYDFTLRWTYSLPAEAEPGAPPSLFTAIKEQLGLRMDAVKGSAEVLVINYVELPSES